MAFISRLIGCHCVQSAITLVALAALAATSAFAQSAVTLYGNIDYSYGTQKTTTANDDNPGTAGTLYAAGNTTATKLVGVNGGAAPANFSSNAIGVMGTEDLGNGMKANFKIENSLTNVNGNGSAAVSAFGGGARETWAGLSGGFGELRIGYQYTDEKTVYDNGEAASGNLNHALYALAGAGRQLRHDAFTYITPAYNGFTGVLQYGSGSNKRNQINAGDQAGAETETQGKSTHQAIGLKYSQGPLTLAAGHSKNKVVNNYLTVDAVRTNALTGAITTNNGNAVVASVSGINFQLAAAGGAADRQVESQATNTGNYMSAAYNFGSFKLLGNYATHKAGMTGEINNAAVNELQRKTKLYQVGVQAPVGKFTPFATFSKGTLKDSDVTAGADTAESKAKSYALGTTYALSKRTSMYAVYTNLKLDAKVLPEAAGALENNTKITQTLVGVRHSF